MNNNIISLLTSLDMSEDAIQAAKNQLNIFQDMSMSCEERQKALEDETWELVPSDHDRFHICYKSAGDSRFKEKWVAYGLLIEEAEVQVTCWESHPDENVEFVSCEVVKTVEEFDEANRPDWEQVQVGWLDYLREVAETGDDYLDFLLIQPKERQTWIVDFQPSSSDMVLLSASRLEPTKGELLEGTSIPSDIREFCQENEQFISGIENLVSLTVLIYRMKDPEALKTETKEYALRELEETSSCLILT